MLWWELFNVHLVCYESFKRKKVLGVPLFSLVSLIVLMGLKIRLCFICKFLFSLANEKYSFRLHYVDFKSILTSYILLGIRYFKQFNINVTVFWNVKMQCRKDFAKILCILKSIGIDRLEIISGVERHRRASSAFINFHVILQVLRIGLPELKVRKPKETGN